VSFHRRIRTIYGKELVDILRDRRTLIAMIVVPIVLYPLLMLGSIQAVGFQSDSMGREVVRIGVPGEAQGHALSQLLEIDRVELSRKRERLEVEGDAPEESPEVIEKYEIIALASLEEIRSRVRDRSIQIGVVLDSDALINSIEVQNEITFYPDMEDVRSAFVYHRLKAMIERTTDRTNTRRKKERDLPEAFDKPFIVNVVDLSAPPSILGQVLPLILILMTITGAIYPAIDLTAGERERGTLESLMVSPVPVIDLIVGKFLVVTTVAIMGASLNLASVTATVYFGGFDRIIASTGGNMPLGTMVIILLCLIPFAVLMSAVMIAVCSYARTFKEAQNYVTPVILAVLIPGGIAALPATRLESVMLVVPVGNMVLLARDLLLGAHVPLLHILIVLLSTSLYAAAAVAVAANIFGHESVVFADAGSLKGAFTRRTMVPSSAPSVSMGLLVVALLFPTWFFVQSALSPSPEEDASGLLLGTGAAMPLFFVIIPACILLYWKVNVGASFGMKWPRGRYLLAGVLLGLAAWIPAHELNVLQQQLVGTPKAVMANAEIMAETLQALPVASVYLLIAIIPALCEELLFRGFLLTSLRGSCGKWTAIVVSAAVFGVFHFFLFKFAVTASLGVMLGYICWQSQSIVPAVLAHLLHNAMGVTSVLYPQMAQRLGVRGDDPWSHLPTPVLIGGGIMCVVGVILLRRRRKAAS